MWEALLKRGQEPQFETWKFVWLFVHFPHWNEFIEDQSIGI